MRLLDAAGGRRRLPGGLGGEGLARSLASGGLSCGLLGSGHVLVNVRGVIELLCQCFSSDDRVPACERVRKENPLEGTRNPPVKKKARYGLCADHL